jgi:hypothetical protein
MDSLDLFESGCAKAEEGTADEAADSPPTGSWAEEQARKKPRRMVEASTSSLGGGSGSAGSAAEEIKRCVGCGRSIKECLDWLGKGREAATHGGGLVAIPGGLLGEPRGCG